MDYAALGAYRKRSLAATPSPADLPAEFLLEWYKDTFDAPRDHTDEELIEMSRLPLASRLDWIEEMAAFTWKARLGAGDPAGAGAGEDGGACPGHRRVSLKR